MNERLIHLELIQFYYFLRFGHENMKCRPLQDPVRLLLLRSGPVRIQSELVTRSERERENVRHTS